MRSNLTQAKRQLVCANRALACLSASSPYYLRASALASVLHWQSEVAFSLSASPYSVRARNV